MFCLLHVSWKIKIKKKKFEVATSNCFGGDAFTWKYIIDLDVTQNVAQNPLHHGVKVTQNVSRYLYIMLPMHLDCLKLLRPTVWEEMHLEEIQYLTLTLGPRSHNTLPSTLYIMWPMQHLHQRRFRRIYLLTNPLPHDPQNLLIAQANRPMKTPGRIFFR